MCSDLVVDLPEPVFAQPMFFCDPVQVRVADDLRESLDLEGVYCPSIDRGDTHSGASRTTDLKQERTVADSFQFS